jgi:succinate dehydrogenase / fumarate reductase cytochrome b subunit
MVTSGFGVWWISVFYIISVGLLCIHLSHGLSAMFQSIGIKSKASQKLINRFALTAALLLFAGYVSVPISVLFGFL